MRVTPGSKTHKDKWLPKLQHGSWQPGTEQSVYRGVLRSRSFPGRRFTGCKMWNLSPELGGAQQLWSVPVHGLYSVIGSFCSDFSPKISIIWGRSCWEAGDKLCDLYRGWNLCYDSQGGLGVCPGCWSSSRPDLAASLSWWLSKVAKDTKFTKGVHPQQGMPSLHLSRMHS